MPAARFLRPDSPWLWAGMFAVVGICGVLIISPKYSDRRERLDLQFQGRQRAMEETSERALEAANLKPAEVDDESSTGSLFWFLGAIIGGSLLLAGFAVYVFQGGYLRAPRMITLPELEPARSDQSAASGDSTDQEPNSPA